MPLSHQVRSSLATSSSSLRDLLKRGVMLISIRIESVLLQQSCPTLELASEGTRKTQFRPSSQFWPGYSPGERASRTVWGNNQICPGQDHNTHDCAIPHLPHTEETEAEICYETYTEL